MKKRILYFKYVLLVFISLVFCSFNAYSSKEYKVYFVDTIEEGSTPQFLCRLALVSPALEAEGEFTVSQGTSLRVLLQENDDGEEGVSVLEGGGKILVEGAGARPKNQYRKEFLPIWSDFHNYMVDYGNKNVDVSGLDVGGDVQLELYSDHEAEEDQNRRILFKKKEMAGELVAFEKKQDQAGTNLEVKGSIVFEVQKKNC